MENNIYKCPKCGHECTENDLIVKTGNAVHCPNCKIDFVIEGPDNPANLASLAKKKRK